MSAHADAVKAAERKTARATKRRPSARVSVHFMESSARPTPRQKLLCFVGADDSQDYMGEDARKHTRTVRRLLRAHERELAERVRLEIIAGDGHGLCKSYAISSAREAILGPQRKRRAR